MSHVYIQLIDDLTDRQKLELQSIKFKMEKNFPRAKEEYIIESVLIWFSSNSEYTLFAKDTNRYVSYTLPQNQISSSKQALQALGGIRPAARILGLSHQTVANFSRNPEAIKFITAEQLKALGIDPWVFYSEETKNNINAFRKKHQSTK